MWWLRHVRPVHKISFINQGLKIRVYELRAGEESSALFFAHKVNYQSSLRSDKKHSGEYVNEFFCKAIPASAAPAR